MNRTERWTTQLNDRGAPGAFGLGLLIATIYLLVLCAFDGIFLVTWGFPEGFYPLWQSSRWSELINAALLGYVPAVLLIARQGIDRDLIQLRPMLTVKDTDFTAIRAAAIGPPSLFIQAFRLSGFVFGFLFVFVDPSISLGTEQSITNPVFVWRLLQTALFGWMVFTLFTADLSATRAYFHMGKCQIEIDLLDVSSLSPFARRGLRSALTWVIFSMIFSLFWLGDAARVNILLFIIVLIMATWAFVVPLIGVHKNIQTVKHLELDRLRSAIRIERLTVTEKPPGKKNTSPHLANLIAYYQLIERTREWPIDALNLLKFAMYLLIGLGSWLGSAMVERVLNRTLGA